jgi:hypothetical protein
MRYGKLTAVSGGLKAGGMDIALLILLRVVVNRK